MGLSIKEQREIIRAKKINQKLQTKKRIENFRKGAGYRFEVNEILVRGIYFLYNNNNIVYIGQSKTNVMERISKHYSDKDKNFTHFRFRAKNEINDKQLDDLEKRLIKEYKPKYNVIHKPKRKKAIIIYGHSRIN